MGIPDTRREVEADGIAVVEGEDFEDGDCVLRGVASRPRGGEAVSTLSSGSFKMSDLAAFAAIGDSLVDIECEPEADDDADEDKVLRDARPTVDP